MAAGDAGQGPQRVAPRLHQCSTRFSMRETKQVQLALVSCPPPNSDHKEGLAPLGSTHGSRLCKLSLVLPGSSQRSPQVNVCRRVSFCAVRGGLGTVWSELGFPHTSFLKQLCEVRCVFNQPRIFKVCNLIDQHPVGTPSPEPQGQRGPSRIRAVLGRSHPSASSQFSPRWTRKAPPGAWSRWGGLRTPARPTICPDSRPVCPTAPPPGPPSGRLLAILLAPPGPSGAAGRSGARARLPGPAPPGAPEGKGPEQACQGGGTSKMATS